jgi:hypothetical protein
MADMKAVKVYHYGEGMEWKQKIQTTVSRSNGKAQTCARNVATSFY